MTILSCEKMGLIITGFHEWVGAADSTRFGNGLRGDIVRFSRGKELHRMLKNFEKLTFVDISSHYGLHACGPFSDRLIGVVTHFFSYKILNLFLEFNRQNTQFGQRSSKRLYISPESPTQAD